MDPNLFAEKLRAYRQSNDLTQEDLARKLYVSRKTVSKWETGRGLPELFMLERISGLFGVTIDELVVDRKKESTSDFFLENYSLKKKYIIHCFLMIFISAIALTVSDIAIVVNENLRYISIAVYATFLIFTSGYYLLNYSFNALPVKKRNRSKYFVMYFSLNRQMGAILFLMAIIGFVKILAYISLGTDIIKLISWIALSLLTALAAVFIIHNLNEIRRKK